MSRLPAALLVFWLALLGGATPALACAADSAGDCCPAGGSAPCPQDGEGSLAGDPAFCCAVTPAPAQATSYSPIRVEHQQPVHVDSPELPLVFVSTIALAQSAARRKESLALTDPNRRDASLTYLYTQRLRL